MCNGRCVGRDNNSSHAPLRLAYSSLYIHTLHLTRELHSARPHAPPAQHPPTGTTRQPKDHWQAQQECTPNQPATLNTQQVPKVAAGWSANKRQQIVQSATAGKRQNKAIQHALRKPITQSPKTTRLQYKYQPTSQGEGGAPCIGAAPQTHSLLTHQGNTNQRQKLERENTFSYDRHTSTQRCCCCASRNAKPAPDATPNINQPLSRIDKTGTTRRRCVYRRIR